MYNKEYYKKHKKYYEKEYYNKHKSRMIKVSMERQKKLAEENNKYFGKECWICGFNVLNCIAMRKNLIKHEINNISHFNNGQACFYHKNLNHFIGVCRNCHNTIHKLMEFNYTFEEILKIFKWGEITNNK